MSRTLHDRPVKVWGLERNIRNHLKRCAVKMQETVLICLPFLPHSSLQSKVRIRPDVKSERLLCFGLASHSTVRTDHAWETGLSDNPVWIQVNGARAEGGGRKSRSRMRNLIVEQEKVVTLGQEVAGNPI